MAAKELEFGVCGDIPYSIWENEVEGYGEWFTAYVAVPKGHPWHGRHYYDIQASIHGGLTFSDDGRCFRRCEFGLGFQFLLDSGAWFVGADWNHAFDRSWEPPYRNLVQVEGVRKDIQNLCSQALEAMRTNILEEE